MEKRRLVSRLGLSPRTTSSLLRAGLWYCEDLAKLGRAELVAIRGIGIEAFLEIREAIAKYLDGSLPTVVTPEPFTPVENLGLSRRSTNALRQAGVKFFEELRQLVPHELTRIRQLGAGSAEEIVRTVTTHGYVMGVSASSAFSNVFEVPHYEPHAETCNIARVQISPETRARLESLGVTCLCCLCSYNYTQLLRLLDFDSVRAVEIVAALECMNHFLVGRSPREQADDSFDRHEDPEPTVATPHNEEFASLRDELCHLTSPSGVHANREKAAAYFAFDGSRGGTLQSVADRFGGVTRQWVAQLVDRVERKAPRLRGEFIHIRATLALLAERAPCTRADAEALLFDASTSGGPLAIEGILNAARLLSIESPVQLWPYGGDAVVPTGSEDLLQRVDRAARKAVAHHGLLTVAEIAAVVEQQETSLGVRVERLLPLLEGFEWLGDGRDGWFWFTNVANNRLVNQIRKCVAVASRLSVGELRAAISRHPELRAYAPPRRVLGAMCERLPFCAVNENEVTATSDLAGELTALEKAFVTVITSSNGGVLSRPDIEIALRPSFSAPSISGLLQHSPIVKKIAYNAYGVVGGNAVYFPTEPSTPRQRTIEDFGWSDDGHLWIEYRVSRAMLGSGIVTIPAAAKKVVAGDYILSDDTGTHIGTLRVGDSLSAWGLKGFFARRGGEPDDGLRIAFDVGRGTAVVTLSQDLPEYTGEHVRQTELTE